MLRCSLHITLYQTDRLDITNRYYRFSSEGVHYIINGPVASKHSNRRSLLNSGSMAIGRTTGHQRHGVGEGGGGNREGTG